MTLRSSLSLLLLAGALPLTQACGASSDAAPAPPPAVPVVSVVEVRPETVSVASEWVATLDGLVNAQIRPQVSGYLTRRLYRDGARVRRGEVLFEIDPRPFEAALAQAQAHLAQAEAELGRAARDVERDTPLARERAIPQSQLDNDIQGHLAAQAAVKSAQAAVDTAALNVEFTRVRSLVDGVAAIATAQIGDLVSPSTLLTTVSQVDPIRAFFSLSEQEYLRVAEDLNRADARLWSSSGGLRLTLADGSEYPARGQFLAADRQIDPRTGTMRISATFPNPRHVLRPGQYGRVQAETTTVDNALLVPQRAISETQGRSELRVVGADGTVHLASVVLGSRVGARRIVTSGLEAGARVIVDAPQLAPGTAVDVRPYTADTDAASARQGD
ncbi:MAG: hypothetical protein ABS36_14225 [Acidobacteria bacterium SCN 69-37]|nr:MAG: hypothetical protein ABS36_14225 [Acidobacteria bacterium SCN 69-37]